MRIQSVSAATSARAWHAASAAWMTYGPLNSLPLRDSAVASAARPCVMSNRFQRLRSCSRSVISSPSRPALAGIRDAWISISTPRGTGGHRADGSGYGLIVFAGILLFVLGFFNMLYGAAAIANSRVFVTNAHYVTGNLRFWGWITLIIAVLQLAAAAGILSDLQLARWSGVALLPLNAIDMMFFLPAYPFWALTIIAVDVVALYGLCAYGSRENLAA